MQDKLLNKIKALLTKGSDKGVSETEGKLFMDKAAELMTKHGLSMSDLPEDKQDGPIEVAKAEVSLGRRKREYDVAVGRILEACFGVKIVHVSGSRDRQHRYWIIGTREDREIAEALIPMLGSTMSRGFLQWQRDHKSEKWSSDQARGYYYGLANGYIQASEDGRNKAYAQATKGQQDAYGLIVVGKKDAIDTFVKQELKLKTLKGEKRSNDAYSAGFARGASLNLNNSKRIS